MISRSLGPEFGGAVAILLFLANAISGAMYIIGAGEAIRDILRVRNYYSNCSKNSTEKKDKCFLIEQEILGKCNSHFRVSNDSEMISFIFGSQ